MENRIPYTYNDTTVRLSLMEHNVLDLIQKTNLSNKKPRINYIKYINCGLGMITTAMTVYIAYKLYKIENNMQIIDSNVQKWLSDLSEVIVLK